VAQGSNQNTHMTPQSVTREYIGQGYVFQLAKSCESSPVHRNVPYIRPSRHGSNKTLVTGFLTFLLGVVWYGLDYVNAVIVMFNVICCLTQFLTILQTYRGVKMFLNTSKANK